MNQLKVNDVVPGQTAGSLIFVVDDEPMLLELASVILEPLGYVVKTFRDPESAVEAFTSTKPRPSLIITDYAMHQMNGMELLEKCKAEDPKLKILLISGTVSEDIYHDSPIQPDKFLAKPYHASELTKLVQSLIGK